MHDVQSIDRAIIAKDWQERGFTCGMWIDHAGREWKTFNHESDELFMALSGELELEIGGERFHPSAGEEILIPKGVPYTICNKKGTTGRWLYGHKRLPSLHFQEAGSAGGVAYSSG